MKKFEARDHNIKDILRIFNVNYNFGEPELKQAYKKVLMLHPDKSGLDSSVFLYYSNAFKQLKYIYSFKNKSSSRDVNIQYEKAVDTYDKDKNLKVDYRKHKDVEQFNQNFNKIFDKIKDKQDDAYDDWFRSKADKHETTVANQRDMRTYFDTKKRELMKHQGVLVENHIYDLGELSQNGTSLVQEGKVEYSSGLFSKLPYEDLKKAHTETIIPVHEDMVDPNRNPSNLESYKSERSKKVYIPTDEESNQMLLERQQKEEQMSANRAFQLYKEMESIEEKNKIINSYRYLLK